MRHINDCCGIIGADAQDLPGLQRLQTLARLENGQGTKQPHGIKIGIIFHDNWVLRMLQVVNGLVTRAGRDAAAVPGYILAMIEPLTLLDASLLPAILIAVTAGLLSFLSPCVLPIVPPYLAYMGGVSVTDLDETAAARRKVMVAAAMFVLGLSTVFLLLGMAFSTLGRALLQWQGWFVPIAGIVVMIFGAHFIGVFRIGVLDREARMDTGSQGGSALGAYVLGLAFAFGWTPCLGPILGTILGLAASEASISRGTVLLAAYAAGLGIPFLLVAAFFPRLKRPMAWMKRHMDRIERTSGLLLWTVGLMMVTGQFTAFSFWLLERFPALAAIG
ncbi:cytochrome c-type biogenesis protein [Loktanella sp. DSM 29012]|nr:cytochrome c-type biogenesis protein [Loktanella sp. DSM 29012]